MACIFPRISSDEIQFYACDLRPYSPEPIDPIACRASACRYNNPLIADLLNIVASHHRRQPPVCRVKLPTVTVMGAEPRSETQSHAYRISGRCFTEPVVSNRKQLRVAVGHLIGGTGCCTPSIAIDLGAVRQTILGTEPRAHRRDRCNSSRSIRSFWRETA